MIAAFSPTIRLCAVALALLASLPAASPSLAATLNCVQVSSSGSTSCRDAGGAPSTCATATCPAGFTLTGGGGACAAGGTRIKSLFPLERNGSMTIVCEQQGVAPEADAVCCRLQ